MFTIFSITRQPFNIEVDDVPVELQMEIIRKFAALRCS